MTKRFGRAVWTVWNWKEEAAAVVEGGGDGDGDGGGRGGGVDAVKKIGGDINIGCFG